MLTNIDFSGLSKVLKGSVAEQDCLSLTLPETTKTCFRMMRFIFISDEHCLCLFATALTFVLYRPGSVQVCTAKPILAR